MQGTGLILHTDETSSYRINCSISKSNTAVSLMILTLRYRTVFRGEWRREAGEDPQRITVDFCMIFQHIQVLKIIVPL